MFKLLIILLLTPTLAFANVYNYKITRVIDGDTLAFEAPFMEKKLGLKPELLLRVYGIDTPEKRMGRYGAKCLKEVRLAKKATYFVKSLIENSSQLEVEIFKHDKYGGRVLGDIIVDGQRLSAILINNGYANAYYGKKKQSNWCN